MIKSGKNIRLLFIGVNLKYQIRKDHGEAIGNRHRQDNQQTAGQGRQIGQTSLKLDPGPMPQVPRDFPVPTNAALTLSPDQNLRYISP